MYIHTHIYYMRIYRHTYIVRDTIHVGGDAWSQRLYIYIVCMCVYMCVCIVCVYIYSMHIYIISDSPHQHPQ